LAPSRGAGLCLGHNLGCRPDAAPTYGSRRTRNVFMFLASQLLERLVAETARIRSSDRGNQAGDPNRARGDQRYGRMGARVVLID
jgi:hypothetical protein